MPWTRLVGIVALAATCGACASTGAKPRPFPTASRDRHKPPASAEVVVRTALDLRGIPYRDGGSDVRGFDCSGFTQYVFRQHGVVLPRAVRDQFLLGDRITRDHVEPGDLVFFSTVADGASHVAIAIGDGQFVHAPSSKGVVRVERLDEPYWMRRFVGIRRVAAAN